MRAQFSNQMPTLKVAAHSVMKLRSSMPNNRWKDVIGGTVDSPTPTVPISSDSTSVMSSSLPKCVDSVMAAIQPAVPPPAITTFLTAPGAANALISILVPFDRGGDYGGENGDIPIFAAPTRQRGDLQSKSDTISAARIHSRESTGCQIQLFEWPLA